MIKTSVFLCFLIDFLLSPTYCSTYYHCSWSKPTVFGVFRLFSNPSSLRFHFQTERFLPLRINKSLTSTRFVFIIFKSHTLWWIIHILLMERNIQNEKLFKVSLSQFSIDIYHSHLIIAAGSLSCDFSVLWYMYLGIFAF